MDFYAPLTWPFILTVCAFVLFMKAMLSLRALIIMRQAWWKYLLVLLPLGVSAWSFVVATHSLDMYWNLLQILPPHGSPYTFDYFWVTVLQAVNASLTQILITLLTLWLTLFLERRAIPRVERTPAWVLARETLLRV